MSVPRISGCLCSTKDPAEFDQRVENTVDVISDAIITALDHQNYCPEALPYILGVLTATMATKLAVVRCGEDEMRGDQEMVGLSEIALSDIIESARGRMARISSMFGPQRRDGSATVQ